jgi:serine protease Do
MRSLTIVSMAILMLLVNSCSAQNDSDELNNNLSQNEAINENTTLALNSPEAQRSERRGRNNDEIYNSRRNAITNAIEKCSPAIVGINVTEVRQVVYRDPFFDDPFFRRFFGNRGRRVKEYEVRGLGSGFLISPDGYILTNHHVAGNASEVVVTMTNGEKYDAEIIGSDMVSDVALLKIEGRNFPYLDLGDSRDIIIGEWAIAFGNPFGLFDVNAKPTVTVGVVSNNDVNFLHEDEPYNRVYLSMIQTDAAISSGNSGGPLVNSLGEVIGMNTIIYSTARTREGAGSIGIGYSIPINRVKEIMELLKNHKKIDRDYYTGMEIREIDEQLAKYIGIENTEGVAIFSLQRRGPAIDAGFELGDIILEIDDMKILRAEDYYIAVGDAVTGQTLNFKVQRNGDVENIRLKLEAIPTR